MQRIDKSELLQLKSVFDSIESYSADKNTGFRSLSNLGVWLMMYVILDDQHKPYVINELVTKAGIAKGKIAQYAAKVTAIINELTKPKKLQAIISAYEDAHGEFSITANPDIRESLYKKASELRILDIIKKYTKFDSNFIDIVQIKMKNTIKFNWRAQDMRKPSELTKTKKSFHGEQMDYLTSSNKEHDVYYSMVEFENNYYHVVRMAVDQAGKAIGEEYYYHPNMYLIQPVDSRQLPNLQHIYQSLVSNKEGCKYLSLEQKEDIIKKFDCRNVVINKEYDIKLVQSLIKNNKNYKFADNYNQIVHFPQLAEKLSTTEMRSGIYDVFVNKSIAGIAIDNIIYLGKRELNYDNKGGEIYNLECALAEEVSMYLGEIIPRKINIEYTVSGPYMMVYQTQQGDAYPFYICDPRKNLQIKYEGGAYPQAQTTNAMLKLCDDSQKPKVSTLSLLSKKHKGKEKEKQYDDDAQDEPKMRVK